MSNVLSIYVRGPGGEPMRPIEPADVPLRTIYPRCSVCDTAVYRDEVVAAGWWYNTDIKLRLDDSYFCAACAALVQE